MKGKTCLVTGATDGIGKVSAQALAEMGAHVIVVGRNADKGDRVIREMKSSTNNESIDFMKADLSMMSEVRTLAQNVKEKYERLDVLLNNVGGFFMKRQITDEGLEMNFVLNHLSYFLLTRELLELLESSKPARIINVSSEAHFSVEIEFENLNGEKKFNGWKAYKKSKLANIMFTYELTKRLPDNGLTVNCLHPGFVATKFGHNNMGIVGLSIRVSQKLSAISEKKGAKTSIFLASSEYVESVTGKYFYKCKPKNSSSESYDDGSMTKLWDVSEEITNSYQNANQ